MCFLFLPSPISLADTLLLKNGHNIEGMIVSETNDTVSINISGGVVDFTRDEINSITRSTSEETEALYARWERRKKKLKTEEASAQSERDRTMKTWRANYARQETLKAKRQEEQSRLDAATKEVPIKTDQGHILVAASINGDVSAVVVLDTGSPTVLLTAGFIEKLKLTAKDLLQVRKVIVLNGEHKAAYIILKSLKIGDVEEHDIPAMVLLEPNQEIEKGCKDGLLGMSFLDRFHVALDQTNDRILLRKDPNR